MQNISEAVVDKVREEARAIVDEAQAEANKEIGKAKTQRDARLEAERRRLLNEANEEAARISAQSAMQSHQKISSAKAEVLDDIVSRARAGIKKASTKPDLLAYLISDAVAGLGKVDKATVMVSSKDLAAARDLVKKDKKLSAVVTAVEACDCDGGAIAQNESETTSVDNTYTTRLEMLLPRVLPEISKELF